MPIGWQQRYSNQQKCQAFLDTFLFVSQQHSTFMYLEAEMTILSERLKEARLETGLSQERLGFLIGFDEGSARSRMNHYETGKHAPDYSVIERLAEALNVPEAYFYTKDNQLALTIVKLHRMPTKERKKMFDLILQNSSN